MKRFIIKTIFYLLALALILTLAYFSFFAWKIQKAQEKITIVPRNKNDMLETLKSLVSKKNMAPLKGEKDGRINILLLGIAGQGKAGTNLTDTIMIASVNTKTNQVALLSIPRDFYVHPHTKELMPEVSPAGGQTEPFGVGVKVPDEDIQMKINSVYQYGLNKYNSEDQSARKLENIISDMTSLELNYYILMNFDGFQKAIDAIGGINVTSARDIYDARYPGPNFSYETFELKKGFQHLDGTTALKYARERHDDPEGDFGRAKRQQEVMQSAKNKIFSAGTLLDFSALNNLINALGDNIKTDITPPEMESFFELSKKLDTRNITNVVVDAWNSDSLLKVSHVFFGNVRAFVLVPRVGNFSEIGELAQNVFDLNKIKRGKEEIAKENASVAIINKSGDVDLTAKIKKLLSDNFGYKNVIVISDNRKSQEDNTTAYDLTGGAKPFTLDEMVEKLPAGASYEISANYKDLLKNINADIVVVLGKDIVSRYNMEEDSVEEYKKSNDANDYLNITNGQ